jgi:AcrR family transcriptional regulator
MNEKIDRRVQRTRRLLQTSILELVVEKEFEGITIEEITERVNLGRTTFYLHYKDKKALLLDSLTDILDALFERIYTEDNLKLWEEQGVDPRRMVFVYVSEYAELFRLLLTGEVGGAASNHFRIRLAEIFNRISENWQAMLNLTPKLPNPVTTHYAAGAFTGLLIWWLENNMPYSAEEIYQMYHQLLVQGASQAIGFPPGPQQA